MKTKGLKQLGFHHLTVMDDGCLVGTKRLICLGCPFPKCRDEVDQVVFAQWVEQWQREA